MTDKFGTFAQQYGTEQIDLPLLKMAEHLGVPILFHTIYKTTTEVGPCWRLAVSLEGEVPTHAILTEAVVVVRQLTLAQEDGKLPLWGVVTPVGRYYEIR